MEQTTKSISGSDSMSCKEDRSQITTLAESLLASISEISASVACIESEQHIFIEIGSYIYRISVVVVEMQEMENSPTNAAKFVESLSKSIDLAKELVSKYQKGNHANLNPEARSIIEQIEAILKRIGEDLSFIPSSTYKDQNITYSSGSLSILPRMAQYMEPLYDTFFCPLTKKIMDDPVTVETGVTYERKAITEWYRMFQNPNDIFCPKTGQKLKSAVLNTNMALKGTIEEWKERNEATRIKIAQTALSLATRIRSMGMLTLLVKFLEYKDTSVRCATLELLLQLARDDEDSKEMVVMTTNMSIIIKMLSSNHGPTRHASLLLLLELSRSQSLCPRIGSVTGAILTLITTIHKRSSDTIASEIADEILRNLERSPENIKCMAENGLLEPLLNHLTKGSEDVKMEMANYIGNIVLGDDIKTQVAERASPALIKMVHSGNSLTRKAAFRALKQISSYQPNSKVLIEAGIVRIMVEEMFARTIYNEPMNSKKEAAAILANILESSPDLGSLQVNSHGHTMASHYIIHSLIHLLKNSSPDELNINLIRMLLCLTNEELGVAATKFLIKLSPYMGHILADRLCKTKGQPEALIYMQNEIKFLAKLPHQNLKLNLALLNMNAVPKILEAITHIQRVGTRISRYAGGYLEGLVGILVRFTTTLYDHQVLFLARTSNFTSVFTELLVRTSSDEVQRLSAMALENLSTQSIQIELLRKYVSFNSSKHDKMSLCQVHRGVCSSQNTFCLIDAKAVERLLLCLDQENVEVVGAALSTLCTLLDDRVDVGKSVSILSGANTIQQVLNVVRNHKEEGLWQKSFWVIERFLMKGGDKSASDISQDRLLPSILVSAFLHGEGSTRQMAENILRYLNKMPN
ncbi:Ubiquitin--protein ligase [Bertholletia excelsa]